MEETISKEEMSESTHCGRHPVGKNSTQVPGKSERMTNENQATEEQSNRDANIDLPPNRTSSSNSQTHNENKEALKCGDSTSGSNAADPETVPVSSESQSSDRSAIRKGKWTVEEEEYTSRIIHYFNTGLLNLPDGATLRSYLADKLNCDPMRITKKYAGAACLGRRAQHFRDRTHPSVAEIQLARAELDHLEKRFRLRVDEGHSSPPLPPQADLLLSLAQANRVLMPNGTDNTQALFQSWLMGMTAQQNSQGSVAQALNSSPSVGGQFPYILPDASTNSIQATNPLLASNPPSCGNPFQQGNPVQQGNFLQSWTQPLSIPGVDNAMANLAFAQAAASLAPAIAQLAAENLRRQQQQQQQLQQRLQETINQSSSSEALLEYTRQLQESFQQQVQNQFHPAADGQVTASAASEKSPVPSQPTVQLRSRSETIKLSDTPRSEPAKEYARQLKQSVEQQIANLCQETQVKTMQKVPVQNQTAQKKNLPVPISRVPLPAVLRPEKKSSIDKKLAPKLVSHATSAATASVKCLLEQQPAQPSQHSHSKVQSSGQTRKRRSEEDKQAGAVLIGFLSSLRNSYEEALREKEKCVKNSQVGKDPSPGPQNVTRTGGEFQGSAESETASAAQVTDNSAQQTESSVEDSDWSSNKKADPSSSEDSDKEQQKILRGKGPPRKRLRTHRLISDSDKLRTNHRKPSSSG